MLLTASYRARLAVAYFTRGQTTTSEVHFAAVLSDVSKNDRFLGRRADPRSASLLNASLRSAHLPNRTEAADSRAMSRPPWRSRSQPLRPIVDHGQINLTARFDLRSRSWKMKWIPPSRPLAIPCWGHRRLMPGDVKKLSRRWRSRTLNSDMDLEMSQPAVLMATGPARGGAVKRKSGIHKQRFHSGSRSTGGGGQQPLFAPRPLKVFMISARANTSKRRGLGFLPRSGCRAACLASWKSGMVPAIPLRLG